MQELFLEIFIGLRHQMTNELSGGSSRYSAVAHLPLIAEKEELVILHFNSVSVGKSPDDGMIEIAVRFVISDGNAETVCQ